MMCISNYLCTPHKDIGGGGYLKKNIDKDDYGCL